MLQPEQLGSVPDVPKFLSSFQTEVVALSRIRHRNQIRMYTVYVNIEPFTCRIVVDTGASKFIRQSNIMTILIQDVNNTMAGYQKEILPSSWSPIVK